MGFANEPVKKCRGCGWWTPKANFYRSGNSKDGLHSYCKACFARKNARRYAKKKKKAL